MKNKSQYPVQSQKKKEKEKEKKGIDILYKACMKFIN
jgi:hypothetical protein